MPLPLLACWSPHGKDLTILVTSYFDFDEEEEDNEEEEEMDDDDDK